MKYLFVFEQEGGCDYTIGCGVKTEVIEAKNMDEAIIKALQKYYDFEGHDYNEIITSICNDHYKEYKSLMKYEKSFKEYLKNSITDYIDKFKVYPITTELTFNFTENIIQESNNFPEIDRKYEEYLKLKKKYERW